MHTHAPNTAPCATGTTGADAKVVASMFRRHGDKGPNNEAETRDTKSIGVEQ